MDAIDTSVNARGAFIARLKPGWHGLGEVRPEWTMEQILEHPGMAFRVALENLTTDSGKVVPGKYATVRDDTLAPLDIVGSRYTVIQHTDEFKLFDEVLAPAGYLYETAGVLYGGAQVFLLAKRPENIMIAEGDEVRQFLLFQFSYDGRSMQRVKTVAERVVCANTLAVALNEKGTRFDYSIRHTASAQEKLQDVRDALVETTSAFERFEQQAKRLAGQDATERDMVKTMQAVVLEAYGETPSSDEAVARYRKAVQALTDEVGEKLTQPNQLVGGIAGTKWSLYNAISEWADHTFAQGVKGSLRAKQERRFVSTISGHAHSIKQAAWRNLLAA